MVMSEAEFSKEWLHGDRFKEIADYVLSIDSPVLLPDVFERDAVIYCDGDFIPGLFKGLESSKRKYILISHNSDLNITKEIYDKKPDCIKYWFAQNVCVKRADLEPIPIGLEREHVIGSRSIEKTTANFHLLSERTLKKHLIYYNVNHKTNRLERVPMRNRLSWRIWVTSRKNRTHEQYMRDILRSRYTLSPPGNGEDCHRTWEALYLGSIPIVKRSVMTEYFAEYFPMYLYSSVKEINKNLLRKCYDEYPKTKDFSVLTSTFWINKIKEKCDEIGL